MVEIEDLGPRNMFWIATQMVIKVILMCMGDFSGTNRHLLSQASVTASRMVVMHIPYKIVESHYEKLHHFNRFLMVMSSREIELI